MGSQVRILYRPPSKVQARDVKSLAFFFLTPRVTPKIKRSRLRRNFYHNFFADVIARFVYNACVFSLNYPYDTSANVETGTTRPELLPADFYHTRDFWQNSSSYWPAFGQLPVLTRMMPQ